MPSPALVKGGIFNVSPVYWFPEQFYARQRMNSAGWGTHRQKNTPRGGSGSLECRKNQIDHHRLKTTQLKPARVFVGSGLNRLKSATLTFQVWAKDASNWISFVSSLASVFGGHAVETGGLSKPKQSPAMSLINPSSQQACSPVGTRCGKASKFSDS